MSASGPQPPETSPPCMYCGAVGSASICAYPDDGGPLLALCPVCARDPERLRALIRALGLGTGRLMQGAAAVDS